MQRNPAWSVFTRSSDRGRDPDATLDLPRQHETVGTMQVISTRLHAARLDEELACGADPVGSDARAAWAAHLLQPNVRSGLAKGLRRAVADARCVSCARSSAVHVARPAVRACAPSLLALAAELGDRGVRPRGVALTRRLLSDGAGPLYCGRSEEELLAVVEEIRAAL
jgi:hypothetical protein